VRIAAPATMMSDPAATPVSALAVGGMRSFSSSAMSRRNPTVDIRPAL
jgi:hypothetical protein